MAQNAAVPATDVAHSVVQRACDCAACTPAEERQALRPKLTLGAPGDAYEQEADRIAEQVTADRPTPLTGPLPVTPVIQRQVEEEEEEEEMLQPKAHGTGINAGAVRQAARAVTVGGRPLPASERAYFEPRFGRDLSAVRLHDGAMAGQAARSIGARAYTLGQNIAFAPGQYTPGTREGRQLMAHELTHTIQQARARHIRRIQRRSIWQQIVGLFRSDTFDDQELRAYLQARARTNTIEDFTDSDNKARAAVNRLRNGDDLLGVRDTARLRSVLVREMLSGFTGNDDEQAILYLLQSASTPMLGEMFRAGGLGAQMLERAFQGNELDELRSFFQSRFTGGREALLRGDVQARDAVSGFHGSVVERARRQLEVVERLLAEAMSVDLERQRGIQARRDLDRTASDAATVMGLRARAETANAAQMNRAPITTSVTATRIEMRVRFHLRFENSAMANRYNELAASLRRGIASVWNQRLTSDTFAGRDFALVPVIEQTTATAARDQDYYLLTVRPNNTGPVNYPGCTFPATPAGVPTSVTQFSCDGGVISIPPAHITRSGTLGHETLHLFGLLDRYLAMTNRTPDGRRVTGHTNVQDRETRGRPDPLGAQEGTILTEDLAFVFDTQGIYERELRRRTGGRSIAALRAEAERLRRIIELGRDPNFLIEPRQDFTRELIRSGEDL